ncbi:hypothetical protein AXF42_Ash006419 [Apostasia shenzhenica]|uniref:Uncharacterized protein n=1 Tax=Apostasia shenzhenica TaxID=1088818 RepID=A0A2I0AZ24_9ASPA|nr:hypothetical protein AXF42_Ash006419 [Apostasia shenzhenica]
MKEERSQEARRYFKELGQSLTSKSSDQNISKKRDRIKNFTVHLELGSKAFALTPVTKRPSIASEGCGKD